MVGFTVNGRGRKVPAGAVHHIRAHGGPDDPLFWDALNHESVCTACHGRVMDEGEFGRR